MNEQELKAWLSPTHSLIDLEKVKNALRAVVELHKSEPRMDETLIRKEIVVCGHCWCNKNTWEQAYRYVYPCPTIQAIIRELK